jgi:ABC-2 type transport system ATP-binding protein
LKKNIADAKNRKCIVIISSHVLDFVDAVSDKVLFLKAGRLIVGEEGTAEAQYRALYMKYHEEKTR